MMAAGMMLGLLVVSEGTRMRVFGGQEQCELEALTGIVRKSGCDT
jgi:hypothetical protein